MPAKKEPNLNYWASRRPREIASEVKKRVGAAWEMFGEEIRRAMIAKAVLDALRAGNGASAEAMDELYFATLDAAGVEIA